MLQAVVPEFLDRHRRGVVLDLFGEIEQAVDVVVIDMADHGEFERKPFAGARGRELGQTRPQEAAIDAVRPAVNQGEARLGLGAPMQQKAIAMFRLDRLENEHGGPRQIDCMARKMSSRPWPWK